MTFEIETIPWRDLGISEISESFKLCTTPLPQIPVNLQMFVNLFQNVESEDEADCEVVMAAVSNRCAALAGLTLLACVAVFLSVEG